MGSSSIIANPFAGTYFNIHKEWYYLTLTCAISMFRFQELHKRNSSWLQKKTSSPPICGALILTAFALPLSLCPTPWNIRALLNSAIKNLMRVGANYYYHHHHYVNSLQGHFESPWSLGTPLLQLHPWWKHLHSHQLSSRDWGNALGRCNHTNHM